MKVPLLDLTAQNAALTTPLLQAFQRVLDSNHFILGPEVEALEQELQSWTGARYNLGVSSGTDALIVALSALGVGPGDEVICPAFTFFATASSVARLGARPVFADICPVCFNLNARETHSKLTPKTRAVIPVHLFGQAADLDSLRQITDSYSHQTGKKIHILEDAAQAIGAKYKGQRVGSMGDFGAFSFFPSKNLGGFGEGGLVSTNDQRLFETAHMIRSHGSKVRYRHELLGGNYRMDAVQAALLRVKLEKLEGYNSQRRRNAEFYLEQLKGIPGCVMAQESWCSCSTESEWLDHIQDALLILPVAYRHNESIWNQFTIRVVGAGRRQELKDFLAGKGVGSEIYYPEPIYNQPCLPEPEDVGTGFPHATRLATECLSLPVYPELTLDQLEWVVTCIREFFS